MPMPEIHLTMRFDYHTLVSHIEEIKKQIDQREVFKRPSNIPVEVVSLMGKQKTLFGFEFPQNNPALGWANKTFDIYVQGITGQKRSYAFRPHMLLAKYVLQHPINEENHSGYVEVYFAIVRGQLSITSPDI